MGEYAKCAWKNLGRKRIRTALTILGISIGVASVILIGNIAEMGTDTVTGEMDSLGLSGIAITASGQDGASLDGDDLGAIKIMSSVKQATPIVMVTTKVSARAKDMQAIVWGVDSESEDIISLESVHGRLFNRNDIRTGAPVCLIDEQFARKTYLRGNIVGKKVSVLCGGAFQSYTVVGVIKTGTGLLQNVIGNYIPTFVYVPYTTLQAATQKKSFDEIAVKIKSGIPTESAGKTIVSRLNRLNGTADAYLSTDLAKQREGLNNILDMVTLVLSAVGAISLLVASLSIMTMMLVSVNERTREIGIKKALGATRGAIMLEFLLEAALLSLIGCVAGTAAGLLISWGASACFHALFRVRPDIMLMASAFAILSGTAFGVYPAWKAACLKPVDALRQE